MGARLRPASAERRGAHRGANTDGASFVRSRKTARRLTSIGSEAAIRRFGAGRHILLGQAGLGLDKKQRAILRPFANVRLFLDREGRMRDRALFDLAIDSKFRGCDPGTLKIGTLVTRHDIRTRAEVVQQKIGRPVQFEITTEVRASLIAWLQRRGGTVDDYAFPSHVDHADHRSTRQ